MYVDIKIIEYIVFFSMVIVTLVVAMIFKPQQKQEESYHSTPEQKAHDRKKDRYLRSKGGLFKIYWKKYIQGFIKCCE